MLRFSSSPPPSAALAKYLHKRPTSQHWQLRMMVPQSARPIVGRREFTRSLGTPDRRQAERLAFPILAGWQAQLAAIDAGKTEPMPIEGPVIPTATDIEEAALILGYEEASRRASVLIKAKAQSGAAAFTALEAEFDRRHGDAIRRRHAGDDSYWRERARRYVAKAGWTLPEGGDGFRSFVQALSVTGTDLFGKARAMIAGTDDNYVPSTITRAAMQRRASRAQEGENLLSLLDRYGIERLAAGKKRRDTLDQDRKVIAGFADFVGHDRCLRSITAGDVREWRNTLAAVPPKFSMREEYQGLNLREVATKATTLGDKSISLITVNRYLSALSALLRWAKREGHVDANICDGLFYDVDKQQNPRPPFQADQLNRILGSPLFTGFEGPDREHIVGAQRSRDWKFWLPIVCLFTGARVGEIAQLRINDVFEDDGHWLINVKNDPKMLQSTKSGKSRYLPIHSNLRRTGFIDFVNVMRSTHGNQETLFPELGRNERGQYGKAARFWRDYLKRIGIKQGADGFGSHSFRHGLADQLRLAGHLDQEIAIVLGHSQKTITAGYGKLTQGTAARLSAIIDGAKFEGVNFEHLFETP